MRVMSIVKIAANAAAQSLDNKSISLKKHLQVNEQTSVYLILF
jgi:hypothetical protein